MTTVEAHSVCKEYIIGEFKVIALENIELTVNHDEFIAIKGASGAGKTTLLNVLASLDKPTSGEVIVDGTEVSSLPERALAPWRASHVGFVFQAFNLISTLTAMENVVFPALFWNQGIDDPDKRAMELLERVGMDERADHLPVQLSAGEQQRVALARALINDPPIIVADEPTANLDETTARVITAMFKEIKEEERKIIIVASHDDKLLNIADGVVTMASGRVVQDS